MGDQEINEALYNSYITVLSSFPFLSFFSFSLLFLFYVLFLYVHEHINFIFNFEIKNFILNDFSKLSLQK